MAEYDEIIDLVLRGELEEAQRELGALRRRTREEQELREPLERRLKDLEHGIEERLAAVEAVVRREGSDVTLCAEGRMTLKARHVVIVGAESAGVAAPQTTVVSGVVEVNAELARFSGVIQGETVIANGVISPSYTTGTGNVW